jgi:pimeloyl-ACP methyl ester carboxylesterase
MGGLLAIALGAQSRERIGGLVLIDPVYPQNDGVSAHDLGPLTPLLLMLMKPLVASFLRDGTVARAISRWMFSHSFTDPERMEEAWCDQRRQVPIEYPKMFYEAFGQAAPRPRAAVRAPRRHAGAGLQPALARARRRVDPAARRAFRLRTVSGRTLPAA